MNQQKGSLACLLAFSLHFTLSHKLISKMKTLLMNQFICVKFIHRVVQQNSRLLYHTKLKVYIHQTSPHFCFLPVSGNQQSVLSVQSQVPHLSGVMHYYFLVTSLFFTQHNIFKIHTYLTYSSTHLVFFFKSSRNPTHKHQIFSR